VTREDPPPHPKLVSSIKTRLPIFGLNLPNLELHDMSVAGTFVQIAFELLQCVFVALSLSDDLAVACVPDIACDAVACGSLSREVAGIEVGSLDCLVHVPWDWDWDWGWCSFLCDGLTGSIPLGRARGR